MEKPKRLVKSRRDKILFGVCGGIAEYLNMDPTVVRILWAALSLLLGCGVMLYIVCALIMPYD